MAEMDCKLVMQDNVLYLVFKTQDNAEFALAWLDFIDHQGIVCFDGYMNAIQLQ